MAHKVLGPSRCSNGTLSAWCVYEGGGELFKQTRELKKPELKMRHALNKPKTTYAEFYTLSV